MVTAIASSTKTIQLGNLDHLVLSVGDSDQRQQWGGRSWRSMTGKPIFELQTALIGVGLLDKADGEFGRGTKAAVERYQWYRRMMAYALKVAPTAAAMSGQIVPASMFVSRFDGACDQGTACQLLSWQSQGLRVTTPLVRVSVKALSNVGLGDSFKSLDYPLAQADEVVVHPSFADFVTSVLNDEAKKLKVSVAITQAFRRENVAPGGAVVHPAKKSQHLVGHAIDLNVVDGDVTNTSTLFFDGKETEAADKFVAAVKARGYRWGGDFSDSDPVHFDDYLNPNGQDWEMTYFFAQRSFHSQHPMRLVN